jgi:hypothetical protein
VTAAFLVWSAAVAWFTAGWWKAYPQVLGEVAAGLATVPSAGAFMHAMAGHLGFVAVVALVALVCWLAGGRILPLLVRRRLATAGEAAAAATATGWVALGLLLFGLALTGLYSPVVIAGACIASAAAGARSRGGRRGGTAPGRSFWRNALLVAAPVLAALPFVLVPPVYVDFNQYHMAAPAHFLAAHRFVTGGVNNAFHFQLTGEMLNALALIAGNDAIATGLALIPFAAALVIVAGWLRRTAGDEAAGLAIGMIVTTKVTYIAAGTGKNDLAEAGVCLIACVFQIGGRRALAAAFWGAACAVKINGLVFAGLAWIWHEWSRVRGARGRWRPDSGWILLVLVPAAPWFAKSWILKGDPQWPALSGLWPGALWDENNRVALASLMGGGGGIAGGVRAVWHAVVDCQPAVVAGLPLLFMFGAGVPAGLRQAAVFAAAAYAVYAATVGYELSRLMLPALMIWCAVAAVCVARLRERAPRSAGAVALAIVCALSWNPVAESLRLSYDARSVRCLTGAFTREQFLESVLTTIRETQLDLGALPGVGTVLLVNDHAPYRWPGKAATEEFIDRKPTWEMTRDAGSVTRLAVRMRQGNITHIATNFVAEESVSASGGAYTAYPWSLRQLRLLRDFMKTRTEVAVAPRHCDAANGGYYVYRLLPRGGGSVPLVFYLPGIQPVIRDISMPMLDRGDVGASRALALRFAAELPDVGDFRMMAAFFSHDDWETAYAEYAFLIRAGMVSDFGDALFGIAALRSGRRGEAIRAFERARELFPDRRELMDGYLAEARTRPAGR